MGNRLTDPPTWAGKHRRARNSHTASKHISAPRISSRATPSNLGSSRCGLQYSGNQFKLNYKYVNDSSNLFWNYTYTSNMTYGNRSQLAEDTFNP